MSGLVKKVGKVFKKVGKFVKKRWKLIVIAAAIYFTAGVALSYFGSTAGFASAMPGFGVGGVFSKAAVYMGFQGSATVASGLSMTSGAFAAGTAAAGAIVPAGTTAAQAAGVLSPVTPTASAIVPGVTKATTVAQAMGGGAGAANAATQTITPLVTGGGAAATKGAVDVMAGAYKMQAASMLLKTAAGFFEPSEEELLEKKHELEWGNAFGVGRDGSRAHGWASSGGSDAFANAGMPKSAQYGAEDNTGGTTKSSFARDFLDSPYSSSSNSNPYTMNQQPDFIQPPGGTNG